jgi:high-affinity iron transporter
MGTWLAFFPTVETLVAQALAAGAVIGSYMVSEYMLVRKPKKQGLAPARRPDHEPALVS